MAGLDGKLVSSSLEGYRGFKLIPLIVRYAAGTPSVVSNPTNEDIALTDVGTGDLTITLSSAGLAPLMAWVEVVPTDANALGLLANLDSAPTSSVVRIVVNSGADGATETDPVDLHVLILKQVAV
jgi:hypothetical protein